MSATRHNYAEIVRILLACPTIDVNVAAPVSDDVLFSLFLLKITVFLFFFYFLFFNRQEGRP